MVVSNVKVLSLTLQVCCWQFILPAVLQSIQVCYGLIAGMFMRCAQDFGIDPLYCGADDPGKPTKGEMAKSVRLLIGNARDDEQLYDSLGRHW